MKKGGEEFLGKVKRFFMNWEVIFLLFFLSG